jgi:ABC-2 type transport system ATP-binding protein
VVTENTGYAIETISLTKVFPDWWGRAKVVAVDDLNLNIKYDEIYGLLGPNGSGKTTTLKLLLNLLHPTKGNSLMLGGHSGDPKISSRIGYLPEDSYLYRYLTARETLEFYGKIFGLASSIRRSRIDSLLEMVGLTGMANRQVGTFSKGMARRIGLAQALINDPDLLILDEPTSGMDPIGTRQMKDLFVQLARRGKTILLCSHLLADVEDVCDRIGILYGGKMQVEGTVRSLLQHTDERQILTGRISDSALEGIKRIVEGERASCEVTSPMDKLEEFFIRTVASAQERAVPTSGAVSTMKITGFLSEEGSARSVLDELVEKKVDEPVGADIASTRSVETEAPVRGPLPNQPDRDLLSRLTTTSVDSGGREDIRTTDASPAKEPSEEVKHDLLEQLRGVSGAAGDGQTESVDPEQAREAEDA